MGAASIPYACKPDRAEQCQWRNQIYLVVIVDIAGIPQQQLARAGTPIPTVFITAHDDAATRQRAQSGAAYLRKPFREAALIGAIRQALELPEA